jgi:hypothetical protein
MGECMRKRVMEESNEIEKYGDIYRQSISFEFFFRYDLLFSNIVQKYEYCKQDNFALHKNNRTSKFSLRYLVL